MVVSKLNQSDYTAKRLSLHDPLNEKTALGSGKNQAPETDAITGESQEPHETACRMKSKRDDPFQTV